MPDFVDSVFNAAATTVETVKGSVKVVGNVVGDYIPTNLPSISLAGSSLPPITPPPPPASIFTLGLGHVSGIYNNHPQLVKLAFFTIIPVVVRTLLLHPMRRALRLPTPVTGNGSTRFEVVLIIGSPDSPFISKLVHDLNKRGYVVFITVDNEKELQIIENMKDNDIRHLWIDWTSDSTIKSSLLKFAKILDSPINNTNAVSSPREYFYNFKAVLFAPTYNHLPKANAITELHTKELQRVINLHFTRLNSLLYNGLSSIMTESNSRRDDVWVTNGLLTNLHNLSNWKRYLTKFANICSSLILATMGLNHISTTGGVSKGGAIKLLWLNFLVQYTSPSNFESEYGMNSSAYGSSVKTRITVNLLHSMNNAYFKILHSELRPSIFESIMRSIGIINDPSKIDMSMLNIDIVRGKGGLSKHRHYDNGSQQKRYSIFGNLNELLSCASESIYQMGIYIYHAAQIALGNTFDFFYDELCYLISLVDGNNSGGRRRGVNPRRVHYLVFDLINSNRLSYEYWIS